MRSSLARDQNNQKDKKKKKMRGKKAPKRTEEEKEVFCRLPDGEAMLTFSFVVSPSRVESQNTRTAALKKLTRRLGESGFGS